MPGFDPAALDRWLTTDPRDRDAEDFEAWCESEGVDPDEQDAWERYEQAINTIEAAAEAEIDREQGEYEDAGEHPVEEGVHGPGCWCDAPGCTGGPNRLARNTRRLLR